MPEPLPALLEVAPQALAWMRAAPPAESPVSVSSTVAVFNAATLGVSEYGLDCLDVAADGGSPAFLTAGGIAGLSTGATVPVASVTTGLMVLGGGASVNVPRASPQCMGDCPLVLTATVTTDGVESGIEYGIPRRSGDHEQSRTVKLARGPRGVFWRLALGGTDGDTAHWSVGALAVLAERPRQGR